MDDTFRFSVATSSQGRKAWNGIFADFQQKNSLQSSTSSRSHSFSRCAIQEQSGKLVDAILGKIKTKWKKTEQAVKSQGCANRAMLSNATVNNA